MSWIHGLIHTKSYIKNKMLKQLNHQLIKNEALVLKYREYRSKICVQTS